MGSRKHGRSGHATQSRDRSGVAQDTLSVRFTASKKNPGKGDKRRGPETRDSWMRIVGTPVIVRIIDMFRHIKIGLGAP